MELTVIQQNDTHGYLETHPEYYYGPESQRYRTTGGFSRAAAYLKKIRREKNNVLFVDGGDLFHGTAPLVLSKGEVLLPLLEAMVVDAFVPGNWDFAYGPSQLKSLTDRMKASALSANVFRAGSQETFLPPFTIKEYAGGLKVGLVGLAYPHQSETMPPPFSEGLSFTLGLKELPGIIHRLRSEEQADLVIILSHMGLPADVKLAASIQGIDLILSGHSHDRIIRPILANGTLIIQSGADSSFLGRLDLEIDSGKITSWRHELIPLLANEVEEDLETKELIQQILLPYSNLLSPEVGRIGTPLHRMTLNEAPMDRFITDAYLHHFQADLSFSHGWRYGAPILPGPVTVRNLYEIIPTNPELFTLELDGKTLLQVLETNLEQVFATDPFNQKGGYLLRSSNVEMAYKPYNPMGHRIQHLHIKGEAIRQDKLYRIVSGGKQLLSAYEGQKKMLGIRAHEAMRAYFNHAEVVTVNEKPHIIGI